MQIEVKLRSDPVFDFGGPWGRSHPYGRSSKSKNIKVQYVSCITAKFQSSSMNIDGGDSRQKRSLPNCCKNKNKNNKKKG